MGKNIQERFTMIPEMHERAKALARMMGLPSVSSVLATAAGLGISFLEDTITRDPDTDAEIDRLKMAVDRLSKSAVELAADNQRMRELLDIE